MENLNFHHRHNETGATDSICLRCYMTVGSDRDERQLLLLERVHSCDPIQLNQMESTIWHLGSSLRS